MGDPQMFGNIEKVVTGSKFGGERLKFTLKRVETIARETGAWRRQAKAQQSTFRSLN